MNPKLEFVINPLLINYLAKEPELTKIESSGFLTLTALNHIHNEGLIGYFINQIGESATINELDIKLDSFKKNFLNKVIDCNSYNKQNELDIENSQILKEFLLQYWNKNGAAILDSIKLVFNNDWEEKNISVYILPKEFGFIGKSNPLLLTSYYKDFYFPVQILIHELIHRHATYSGKNSLYSLITSEGYKYDLGEREVFRKIIHPLFFFISWYITKSYSKERIVPFYKEKRYLSQEGCNVIVIKKLASIIKPIWEDFYHQNMTGETFVKLIFKGYGF